MVIKERALPRRGCVGIVPACVRMAMLVFCPSGLEYCVRCGVRNDPFYRPAGDGIPEMNFDNNSLPTSLSCGFQRAVTDKSRLKPGSSSTLVAVAFPIIVSLTKR